MWKPTLLHKKRIKNNKWRKAHLLGAALHIENGNIFSALEREVKTRAFRDIWTDNVTRKQWCWNVISEKTEND